MFGIKRRELHVLMRDFPSGQEQRLVLVEEMKLSPRSSELYQIQCRQADSISRDIRPWNPRRREQAG